MKNTNLKILISTGSVLALFLGAGAVHANTNVYRMYNPKSGEHFWTSDGNEKQSLIHIGWKYEGLAWSEASSGKTPIYRMYNPKSGEHFYTTAANERNSLQRIGWHYEGIFAYSAGNIPVYRLYNPQLGSHLYTTDAYEKNVLPRQGWKYEGVAFYASGAEYNWYYDTVTYSYSGQETDVHLPQFDYLTSTEGRTTTYSGNNAFYAYNDAVFNFNTQLQADAKSADYADMQARQNWVNTKSKDTLAVSNAQATVNTQMTKVSETQKLVDQANTAITADKQHGLDSAQHQSLLEQYQKTLASDTATLNTDKMTLQNATNVLNALVKNGTDYVKLNYSVNFTNNRKTVSINFRRTTYTNGKSSTSNLTRSATLSAD